MKVIPAQAGIQVIPAQAGIQVVPAQAGTQVVPAQAGIQVIPARAGIQVIPARTGIQVVPARTGTRNNAFPPAVKACRLERPPECGLFSRAAACHDGVIAVQYGHKARRAAAQSSFERTSALDRGRISHINCGGTWCITSGARKL